MSKGPILAVAISILLLLLIYLFVDIRPSTLKSPPLVEDATLDLDPVGYILAFNEQLSDSKANQINNWLSDLDSDIDPTSKIEIVDSIIKFYETNEQYNFSAWFHSEKAKLIQTPESWATAGKRQYSVSQNEAYEEDFNRILRKEGIKSYQKAIELDSSNLDTKVALATCFLYDGKTTMDGITLLLGVIEADSLHVNANILLGRFGIVSTQYDKAIKRLENVLSLQPENTEALFLIGEAYVGLGQVDKAVEAFKKVRQLIENEEIKREIDVYIEEITS